MKTQTHPTTRIIVIVVIAVFGVIVFTIVSLSGRFILPTPPSTLTNTPLSNSEPTLLPTNPADPTRPPISTRIPILSPTPPSPPPCGPQYPSTQAEWKSDYISNSYTSLERLYTQIYGRKRDSIDLFAVAYYNNLKALEDNSYHAIDPARLIIEKEWKIFLPPPAWIETYRAFPIPILEKINQNNTNSTINISGSSALYPLTLQMSNCFTKANKTYQVQAKSNSTKLGLLDYCQGDVDIFSASEEITQEMTAESGCEGVKFLKFEVATYAVTIFINEKNPYANNLIEKPLTREELRRLLFFVDSWSDVRSSLGDETINRYYPPVEGGIFEIVKNEFFRDGIFTIPNLFETEEEYLIPSKVIGDYYSIGFSSYGYEDHPNNKDDLRIIPIDNISLNSNTLSGDNPIYPLTRSLYLYTGEADFNNPLVKGFINYYLAYEFGYIDELGYFYPNRDNWLNNPNTIP